MHGHDFTEKQFKKILRLAKERYKIISFNEIKRNNNFMLLRHDIDYSIHRAYSLAKIEKKEEVTATYFLLPSSFFYNIFEYEIRQLIIKIINMGHKVGLHFDAEPYQIKSGDDLSLWLNFEKNILESLFRVKIKVFSFHNPTKRIMKYDAFKYAGMINTYAKYFKENTAYCSDSNGYWRYHSLENVLRESKYDKLQALIHPEWWQKKPMLPRDRIKRCIHGRAEKQQRLYDVMLKKHGRKNIGI